MHPFNDQATRHVHLLDTSVASGNVGDEFIVSDVRHFVQVLFGVGASKDFDSVQPRQAKLLRQLLSQDHVQPVRDGTGRKLLETVGIKAANTSCATLFRYRDANPQVPVGKAPAACFTLAKHTASDTTFLLSKRCVDVMTRSISGPSNCVTLGVSKAQPRRMGYKLSRKP